MSSDKFLRLAKMISERDKPVFDELINYEKTGKIRSKTRMNFTVDKSTAANFKKYCKNNGYNMSSKIENAMKEMIDY
ncbi:TPA: hypothetical protein HA235_00105 [Candidatus Woesearchaeota archaeon]|nr:hypothetical protein [Candidatus Woesearchaeota archaeon]HIH31087.1 hypothetical protein [Candidatus Woesearchaeota archaeon]HIH55285.1 hypothetical protein [Candidatus Woesearchaeota archaeon]HIJ01528.1 hypothetical protein [Candidatus Woesearchaeota archaeon]HIJ13832.1 hypothetical protein [Candidatus Woesearchaeota archaeon]